jgi:hypothetical protein
MRRCETVRPGACRVMADTPCDEESTLALSALLASLVTIRTGAVPEGMIARQRGRRTMPRGCSVRVSSPNQPTLVHKYVLSDAVLYDEIPG